MRSIESSGKTVEEAIALALDELGLSIADVLIDVLDHGKQGLFGIGNKLARVKVTELAPEEAILPRDMQLSPPPPKPKAQPQPQPRAAAPAPQEAPRPRPAPRVREPREETITPPDAQAIAAVEQFFNELLGLMGVRATHSVDANEEAVLVSIDGEDAAILIGHRGETLDALQYLASLTVNKASDAHVRVRVDVAGYRARREESLARLALRSADRAQRSGRRVVLDAMNPYERRILHTALQDVPGISTHSEGEEPNRRVVITPAQEGGRH